MQKWNHKQWLQLVIFDFILQMVYQYVLFSDHFFVLFFIFEVPVKLKSDQITTIPLIMKHFSPHRPNCIPIQQRFPTKNVTLHDIYTKIVKRYYFEIGIVAKIRPLKFDRCVFLQYRQRDKMNLTLNRAFREKQPFIFKELRFFFKEIIVACMIKLRNL